LAFSHPILAQRKNRRFGPAQFLQSKTQGRWSTRAVAALLKPTKEQSMEYLILVAVVSVMALYALIIIGCLKQPEW
jgi:F0F1-type ATP synthase membrane subunit c/vacuolar-type H+-ATPase subunit K